MGFGKEPLIAPLQKGFILALKGLKKYKTSEAAFPDLAHQGGWVEMFRFYNPKESYRNAKTVSRKLSDEDFIFNLLHACLNEGLTPEDIKSLGSRFEPASEVEGDSDPTEVNEPSNEAKRRAFLMKEFEGVLSSYYLKPFDTADLANIEMEGGGIPSPFQDTYLQHLIQNGIKARCVEGSDQILDYRAVAIWIDDETSIKSSFRLWTYFLNQVPTGWKKLFIPVKVLASYRGWLRVHYTIGQLIRDNPCHFLVLVLDRTDSKDVRLSIYDSNNSYFNDVTSKPEEKIFMDLAKFICEELKSFFNIVDVRLDWQHCPATEIDEGDRRFRIADHNMLSSVFGHTAPFDDKR